MSVSISPPCSRRCAHRGRRWSGRRDGGDVPFLCQPSLPAPSGLCTFAHPSSNLWGEKGGECNQHREGRKRGGGGAGGVEGVLCGLLYKDTRGRLTGSASNPRPSRLYLSEVQRLRSVRFATAMRSPLLPYLIIFRPCGAPRTNPPIRTALVQPCQPPPFFFCVASETQRWSFNLFNLQLIVLKLTLSVGGVTAKFL